VRSHTVPRKLLEQFAFYHPGTKSYRLWTYKKGVPPYMASPRSATRWEGHFSDPRDAAKEQDLERRLKREVEEPVNQFLDSLKYSAFVLSIDHRWKLTRYITLLFHRSVARLGATRHQMDKMLESMEALLANEEQLQAYANKITIDLLASGVQLERPATKEDVAEPLKSTIEQHKAADQLRHQYA
jgi:DNA repair ATPase RecN